ncbi:MAG: DUF4870 domain-containing protein [Naasia sp.]
MSATPPPPPSSHTPPAAQAMSPEDQRLWATLNHIGGIFFGVISALIIYLVLKDRGGFIREHSRTALNFQITMTIASIALSVIGFILTIVIIGAVILAVLPFAYYAVVITFAIIAAVKANKGEQYSYPLAINFVK